VSWSRKVKADVRRVRALPPEAWAEVDTEYTGNHTMIGRSFACSVCGALGTHSCIPTLVDHILHSKTLQEAIVEFSEAYNISDEYHEESTDE
jgi:hypothetical protein